MRIKDEAKEFQIIKAAIDLIANVGLDGLKMANVALNAGVATGTVYIYFKDKEALIIGIYKYIVKDSVRNFNYEYDAEMHVKAKIKSLTRAYLDNFIKYPGYSAFLEQFYRSSYFQANPQFMQIRNDAYKPVFAVIKQGQAQGIIKNIDAIMITVILGSMLREICKLLHYDSNVLGDQQWEDIFSVVWDGMRS